MNGKIWARIREGLPISFSPCFLTKANLYRLSILTNAYGMQYDKIKGDNVMIKAID